MWNYLTTGNHLVVLAKFASMFLLLGAAAAGFGQPDLARAFVYAMAIVIILAGWRVMMLWFWPITKPKKKKKR